MSDEQYRMFVVWVAGQEDLQTPPGYTPKRSQIFATDMPAAIQIAAYRWKVPASTLRAALV